MRRLAVAVAAAASLAACESPGATKPTNVPPTDLPLAVVPILSPLPDGGGLLIGLRLVTSISVEGSAALEATIDTGSAGLQLLANLLPSSTLSALGNTGAVIEQSYPESGIQATGYIANATVSFGDGGAVTEPIPVAVLEQLSCMAGNPCDIDAGPLEGFIFNGSPALLGLGMRSSNVGGFGNPIVQLPGAPPFIVEAPSFGGDAGILRIAPTALETAAYRTVQLPSDSAAPLNDGVAAWNDFTVPACVTIEKGNVQYCGNAVLDTGTPLIEVNWTGVAGYSQLVAGTEVSVSIGATSDSLGSFEVTIGDPPQLGLDDFVLAPPLSGMGEVLVLGLPLFARYNVLFDQAKGQVGLLPH